MTSRNYLPKLSRFLLPKGCSAIGKKSLTSFMNDPLPLQTMNISASFTNCFIVFHHHQRHGQNKLVTFFFLQNETEIFRIIQCHAKIFRV